MNPMLERATQVLFRHPAAAVPFSLVAHEVERDTPGPGPEPGFLLRVLESHPDRVRVLHPWRGPWTPLSSAEAHRLGEYRGRLREEGVESGPWLVPGRGRVGGDAPSPEGWTDRRLRESLHALAVSVDEGSTAALARWLGIVREADLIHSRLRQEIPFA
jgi:hypothetical protein